MPPIEEKDLKKLLIDLRPVCIKWRALGIALEVQHLDIIEADNKESVERMLEKMLRQWLTSDETYWSDLARALDSPLVIQTALAKKIRDSHCPDFILPSETLRQQSPQQRREHPHPFPCDDKRKFYDLVSHV